MVKVLNNKLKFDKNILKFLGLAFYRRLLTVAQD